MKLIGVDVGGTVTDVAFADTETDRILTQKVPTTPDDPSAGVLHGIALLCARHEVAPAAVRISRSAWSMTASHAASTVSRP